MSKSGNIAFVFLWATLGMATLEEVTVESALAQSRHPHGRFSRPVDTLPRDAVIIQKPETVRPRQQASEPQQISLPHFGQQEIDFTDKAVAANPAKLAAMTNPRNDGVKPIPPSHIISVRAAIDLIHNPDAFLQKNLKLPASMSPEQYRLVQMIAMIGRGDPETKKFTGVTKYGAAFLQAAVEQDLWLAVDYNQEEGNAFYDELGFLGFVMPSENSTRDHDAVQVGNRSAQAWLWKFYHEATHFMQHKIWNVAGQNEEFTSIIDEKDRLGLYGQFLYETAMEAQADMIANAQIFEHKMGQPPSVTLSNLYAIFLESIDAYIAPLEPGAFANFDDRFYEGAQLDIERFVTAFGFFPGKAENFLNPYPQKHKKSRKALDPYPPLTSRAIIDKALFPGLGRLIESGIRMSSRPETTLPASRPEPEE